MLAQPAQHKAKPAKHHVTPYRYHTKGVLAAEYVGVDAACVSFAGAFLAAMTRRQTATGTPI